jgi:hypothetical protein
MPWVTLGCTGSEHDPAPAMILPGPVFHGPGGPSGAIRGSSRSFSGARPEASLKRSWESVGDSAAGPYRVTGAMVWSRAIGSWDWGVDPDRRRLALFLSSRVPGMVIDDGPRIIVLRTAAGPGTECQVSINSHPLHRPFDVSS